MDNPPDNLVCLLTIPQERWVGMVVYHPLTQIAGVPYWRELDTPVEYRVDFDMCTEGFSQDEYSYDLGTVISFGPDSSGELRVCFDVGGFPLSYPPDNLWVVPRSCNLHDDCDAANTAGKAAGKAFTKHCNSEDCEECFGS